ncbi:hypothetical protein [Streptomyces sp. NPDC050534]|uniref:hypothetical protein n=1 Tax=Streptomyces sp. NPDC050534 TaxID=3365625 RepID=UPI0037B16B7A
MELAIDQVLGGDDATQSFTRTGPGTPWILACVMSTDTVLEQTRMPMVSSAWTRRWR